MKFKIKYRFFGSFDEFTFLEKLRLALDYFRTGQIRKLFHITLDVSFKSKLRESPHWLVIEPTSLCNAKCALCPTPSEKLERSIKFLPMNKYKQIIDKTKNYVKKVTFFVAGEPFMNKNLCKMITYATKNGLHTFVSTNGTFLNKQTINELLETKLDQLDICLDGSKKETHEIYKKNTNFELICKNIQTLTSEKRKRKKIFPKIFIQALITRYNEDELGDIANLAKNLGTEGVFFKSLFIEKNYDQGLAKKFLPRKSWLSRYETIDGQTNCQYLNKILILCDGRVAICDYDFNGKFKIGNAFFQNMISLWNSKKYKNLRKKMKRKELDMCNRACGHKKVFEEDPKYKNKKMEFQNEERTRGVERS